MYRMYAGSKMILSSSHCTSRWKRKSQKPSLKQKSHVENPFRSTKSPFEGLFPLEYAVAARERTYETWLEEEKAQAKPVSYPNHIGSSGRSYWYPHSNTADGKVSARGCEETVLLGEIGIDREHQPDMAILMHL